jgi:2-haloacid dehalogenase
MTFDCFGTLVDWQAAFAAALGPLVGDRASELMRAYHVHEREVERELPHRAYKDVLASALTRAAHEQGVTLPPSAARTLETAWPSMQLFDDVEPMLDELRARGWRLAVLTNCDDDLFAVTHGLFRMPFDFVLTAERVRGYKPAPWHFRGFERLTGVARHEWVHVANSLYHDIAPAQSLGVPHVWLDRDRPGEAEVTPDAHVQSGADVAEAAARLVARRSNGHNGGLRVSA